VLIYAGIDEAGYGPMLGPLCVGLTVIGLAQEGEPVSRAGSAHHDGAPPDLWSMLAPVVWRSAKDAEKHHGVAIDDSKRLKLSNQLKTKHPLVHLEKGVLCCGRACWGERHAEIGDDEALKAALGCPCADEGDPLVLPLANDAGALRLTGVKVGGAFDRAGVRVLDLSCRRLEAGVFNERLGRLGTKASVSWSLVQELVARLWHSHALKEVSETPRLVLDRQGGRTSYAPALRACVGDDVQVETVGERSERSVYELGAGDGRRLRVIVQKEAENDHLPVALASMTAKLVRELAMERFNRAWAARLPELKPTAGYVTDARRWLSDVRATGAVAEGELTPLIRRA
jgi:hypothetical protein